MWKVFRYGIEKLGIEVYEAKIKCDNVASIRLFTDQLCFQEVSRSEVFQEVTLELQVVGSEVAARLANLAPWDLTEEKAVTVK